MIIFRQIARTSLSTDCQELNNNNSKIFDKLNVTPYQRVSRFQTHADRVWAEVTVSSHQVPPFMGGTESDFTNYPVGTQTPLQSMAFCLPALTEN